MIGVKIDDPCYVCGNLGMMDLRIPAQAVDAMGNSQFRTNDVRLIYPISMGFLRMSSKLCCLCPVGDMKRERFRRNTFPDAFSKALYNFHRGLVEMAHRRKTDPNILYGAIRQLAERRWNSMMEAHRIERDRFARWYIWYRAETLGLEPEQDPGLEGDRT